ncbi:hypothetical protein F5050DRAFT_1763972 [Lentinula boryana]|uniref:Uncharacterized protein n=1 Tax=Lentinula boryana TaxID=40481 RepID=A0ABQ8QBQ7_9AGAR|nr:hypothetical protein F5050DRAFT_1763972 [Lentinula boryana]
MQSSLPSQPEGGTSFLVPGQRNSRNSTTLNEINLQRQLAEWKRRALVAEGQVMIEQAEREAATVHAVLAGREASILKYQLNANTRKKTDTSKCFTTSARIVTSAEGKEQAIAEASKRDAKKNELEEKKKKKQDTERADFLRCAEQEREQLPFSGSLRSKLKAELQDILFALGLDIKGNVAALLLRINAHFDTETALKQDPRYVGLFSKPSGKRKQAAEDHSETMQPSPPIHHSPSPIHSQPPIPPQPRPHPRIRHIVQNTMHDSTRTFTDTSPRPFGTSSPQPFGPSSTQHFNEQGDDSDETERELRRKRTDTDPNDKVIFIINTEK